MKTKIKLSKCTFIAVCVILLLGITSCKKTEVPLQQNGNAVVVSDASQYILPT